MLNEDWGKSAELINLLFESARNANIILEKDSRAILAVNKTASALYGYTHDEFCRLHETDITADAKTKEQIEFLTPSPLKFKYHKKKDGTVFPVDIHEQLFLSGGKNLALFSVRDISMRAKAQQDLLESGWQLRFITENLAESMIYQVNSGPDGNLRQVTYVSPSVERMHGFSAEKIKTDASLLYKQVLEEDKNNLARHEAQAINTRTPMDVDIRLRMPSGEIRWRRFISSPRVREDGCLIWDGIELDITSRKQSEQKLLESERQVRFLNDNLADGMVYQINSGIDGTLREFSYISPAVERMHGLSVEEARTNPARIYDQVIEEDRFLLAQKESYAFSSRTKLDMHLRLRLASGEIRWRHFISSPRTREDWCVLWDGIELDITERKKAEDELLNSEEKYRSIVDMTADWIWEMNLSGQHTFSNPRIKDILGYDVDEFLTLDTFQLFHPDDQKEVKDKLARLIDAKQGWRNWTMRWRHKDGTFRYLESNAMPILDKNDKLVGFRGADRDITERINAEEKRLDTERQILHTQKLESIGVLAGGIAHDFNNLLMAMMGHLELASSEMPKNSLAHDDINKALFAANQAADLTRQMLAYAGKGKYVLSLIDVSNFVEQNLKLLRISMSKSIVLNLTLGRDLPPVEADQGQFQQIVMNLITNASESIGENPGIITISTGCSHYTREQLEKNQLDNKPKPGKFVWMEIKDTGCGMDQQTLQRIFDPFFTTKFIGRGLGMAAVMGIVKSHHGAILIDSEVGRGTTIIILFPACYASNNANGKTNGSQPAAATPDGGPQKTVMVVDDEDVVLDVCRRMVAKLGYKVLTATNGLEAVNVFQQHKDHIDCVLLDLSMPFMDGLTAYCEMSKIKPGLKAVLSSGYDREEMFRRCANTGVKEFIQKPYALNNLRDALIQALDNNPCGGAETRR